ncbi:hypothetical protein BRADI_3g28315v3 [Brachypodium distachyon]|uniref:Uncharacterized protein n=1 Tax=Brachypodium distachyon TaxID=15368 RepID=A0A0Q3HU18_BRADI|nr:hypothetical protein BRADI_3g28315v3 [Brachypodium distachyon]
MAFLLGSLRVTKSVGGGRRRMDVKSGAGAVSSWRRAPAPVRQLFWRVRRAVMQRPKRGAVRFGYDLKSYYQNFDDGLVASRRRF